ADAAAERATDERDALAARGPQAISCRAKIFDLRDIVLARPRSARPEGDRLRRDAKYLERRSEPSKDRLLRGAAVAGREDRRAFQAGGFGSFCARASDGLRRSPTASSRADMFMMVKASGRPRDAISSHRSGAETGARRIGRTLYGPAVDLARVFWR